MRTCGWGNRPTGTTEAVLRRSISREQTPWLHVVGRIQKDQHTQLHTLRGTKANHPKGLRVHTYVPRGSAHGDESLPSVHPGMPNETHHQRTKRAYLVGLHSISEQSHPIQSLSPCVALSQSFQVIGYLFPSKYQIPNCSFVTRK